LVITPDGGHSDLSVREWLERELFLPSGFVRKLLREKRLRVRGKELSANDPVPIGAKIWIEGHERDEPFPIKPVTDGLVDGLSVLYEDAHLLVVDKRAGWLVHSDGVTDELTLVDMVRAYLSLQGDDTEALHIHRLDKETTGCVLFAKHPFSSRALDSMLANRAIHRTYLAVVAGCLPKQSGRFEGPIGRDRHRSGAYRVSVTGRSAITLYERLHVNEEKLLSVVTCQLETGRTHQIRVHMANVNCPIVGDEVYGGPSGGNDWKWAGPGQALHAWKLSFSHPYTGESIEVECPIPSSLGHLCQDAGWWFHN
jgi:23S rRNA pseudouridine1911/1915/1917 synthase